MVNSNNAFNHLAFVINRFLKRALNILVVVNVRHHRLHIETAGGDSFNSHRVAVGIAENGLNLYFAVNFQEVNCRIPGDRTDDHDFPSTHDQIRCLLNGDGRTGGFEYDISPHVAG